MDIQLQKLTLHNFKGVRDLSLNLYGRDATISGTNAAGKTSVIDAFLWLLFDKDSKGSSNFNVKTLDADDKPIHNLEHEVEAVVTIDGRDVTLRKLLREKWEKKRGESQQVFSGHTTDYWIDDVPTKAGDFKKYIAGLIDEDLFRLLTSPTYFNVQLHWEKRRKLLLELCGEISVDAVIGSDVRLSGLRDIMGDRSIDDTRKVLNDRRRKINDELTKIPAQIEAVTRTIPELLGDYAKVESDIKGCQSEIESLDAEMSSASRAVETIRAKGRELARLEKEQRDFGDALEKFANIGFTTASENLEKLQGELTAIGRSIATLKSDREALAPKIAENEVGLDELRDEYNREYATAFETPSDDEFTCRHCGQALPSDKREEHFRELERKFNEQHNARLDRIANEGKDKKKYGEVMSENLGKIEQSLLELDGKQAAIMVEAANLRADIEHMRPEGAYDPTSQPDYVALQAQIDASSDDTTADISARRNDVNARMAELMKVIAERDAAGKSRALIDEYSARERELADQLAELDGQLFAIETYVRAEAELLETSVNEKFNTVRFKMFDDQINGGLKPTCEALIDGVPYSDANSAGQFNAGMEIIDALCKHYDAFAPVFVDQCESIVDLVSIAPQMICMKVDKNPVDGAIALQGAKGTLYIETESKKKAEVA
ncbi:MAG: AAA family ATPase [Oscillospiraceae bacterium]|jgi:chromosome segregation ATPase|nr:AAA family ATPase [Oscillospiraceae bacterium]